MKFFLGWCLGYAVSGILMWNTGTIGGYHDLQDECEKLLPRTEQCIMIAVPQVKETK